ncbi:MAG: ribonuclease HII [Dictyoglomus turgidum]|uniref:ribonuclease HII n=1 Tax=Dictyoglomus turgidum TaxID=513050 RepID=UPI003C72CFC7
MYGRSWKLDINESEKIKSYLIKMGGVEESIKNSYELWRIKLGGSTFIYYTSGKLYSTPSAKVINIWDEIDKLVSKSYDLNKDYVLGFDEVGKGEVFGPIITCGVLIRKDVISQIPSELKTPDTKKSHGFEYWTRILKVLEDLISDGFYYIIDIIQPREIDRFNINQLLDLSYMKLIKQLITDLPYRKEVRIVIDDYGVGEGLQRFLEIIKGENNFETIIVTESEDKFLEAKLASLIAKSYRESILKNLQERYEIPESLIKGNMSNKALESFLKNYSKEDLWFIRRSFGKRIKKEKPSFYNLISEDNFRCLFCGKESSKVILKDYRFLCSFCGKEIKDLELAMKYHSGIIKLEKESFYSFFEIIKNSYLFDGFSFLVDNSLRKLLTPYEDIGRILILKRAFSKFLTLKIEGDSIAFSFFRNIYNV